MNRALLLLVTLAGCRHASPEPVAAPPPFETGGFIATLGTDTVHIESFTTTAGAMRGTIVTRVPTTRVITWSLTHDSAGMPLRYTIESHDIDLRPLTHAGAAGSMDFGDTTTRTTTRGTEKLTHRIATPRHTFPGATVPYIGVSYLLYEAAFADARRRAAERRDTSLWALTMHPAQLAPSKTRAWLIGADSAELSYFGVAKSGYRFDDSGRLLNADWTRTTYRYRVRRIPAPDVVAIAQRWTTSDRAGRALGALSPRDTLRATLGAARITIDYSRPSRRGRVIWGDVVPWDTVWRLGADRATHLTTSADLVIGDVSLPAGQYTLWMIPSYDTPLLVVSSAVNVFGTAYDPARDFARIPMYRMEAVPETERLTLAVADGRLYVRWDEMAWWVPLTTK